MAISIKDVSFAYGEKQILSHFTLHVRSGERLWISAPSGFGKTTLLRLICGLERPAAGEIEIPEEAQISGVFQEDRLLPWLTVADNVALVLKDKPKAEKEQLVKDVLAAVGLEDEGSVLPAKLSGGMARRVAIARAMAAGGDILILDEPFVGLDDAVKQRVAGYLSDAFAGKTIIISTHDPAEAQLLGAERIDIADR